jgi:hypothetical protein
MPRFVREVRWPPETIWDHFCKPFAMLERDNLVNLSMDDKARASDTPQQALVLEDI